MLVFACACGQKRHTPQNKLVALVKTTIKSVDPRNPSPAHAFKIAQLIAPGLTTTDQESMAPKLRLASEITQVDDTNWKVKIREDAKFSDGSQVTAADVVATYMNKIASGTNKGFSEKFKKISALKDGGVHFELNKPVATFLADLEFSVVKEKEGGNKAIGAGPMMLVSSAPEGLLLKRNPYYFGKVPAGAVDEIEVKVVQEEHAMAMMLIGGSADVAQNVIRVDLAGDVAARSRVEMVRGPSAILTYLMMNNEDSILKNRKVRKAIAFAIDREAIVESRYSGRAVLASGLLAPSHWAYDGNVPKYNFDIEKAKRLLDEAGYPDPDGDGPQVRFELTYKTSASSFRIAIARTIAKQLQQVGIKVDVRPFEFHTFFRDIKRGDYQLGAMQTTAITDPDYFYTYYHSSRIPKGKSLWGHNRWRFRSVELDRLVEQGRTVADSDGRKKVYSRVQEILATELPVVPLWHEDNIALVNRDVAGFFVLPSAKFASFPYAVKTPSGP